MSPTPTDPNQAQAWITGDPPDQTIDFYIPRGNTGPMGPQGPIGPSLVVGDIVTNMGPAAPGTMGPQGPQGLKGDPGAGFVPTDLGANDLNNIITPGTYRQTNGSNVTITLNYPFNLSLPAVLIVYSSYADNSRIEQELRMMVTPASNASRVFYKRTLYSGVWSPWRTYSSSRFDQTAGRVIYQWDDLNNRDQLVYGDTGERDIRTAFGNGTFAALKLRRFGNVVFLTCVGWAPPANSTANLLLSSLPVGFRNNNTLAIVALENGSTFKACTIGANTSAIAIGGNLAAAQYNFHTSWLTVDSWPTTLPGDVTTAPPAS